MLSPVQKATARTMGVAPLRVMQWNVFEDGLTDAPGSIGFSSEFEQSYSSLLSKLGQDSNNAPFWGFGTARDCGQLPPVASIDSTRAFFNFIDVVYTRVYHSFGGEARFGSSAPGDAPNLGNSVRTLFLHSALPDVSQAPSADNPWRASRFETEINKISATLDVASRVRQLKESAFDPASGTLAWDRASIDGHVWKRTNNVWKDKWAADLAVFIRPPTPMEPPVAMALSRLFRVQQAGADEVGVSSLISVVLDDQGQLQLIRTLTLQAAVYWLLFQLCEHSLLNPDSRTAICTFAGIEDAPATAEARTMAILPRVLAALEDWFTEATLTARHVKMCRVVEQVNPDICTLVEFDEQWRRLPPPTYRRFQVVAGKGTAAVMFDADKFDRLETLNHAEIAPAVQAISARIEVLADGCEHKVEPKSSCVVLLQRREDSTLFLVTALHLESAPPSDSKKVNLRQLQARAALVHLAETTRLLKSSGHRCVLIMAGDFNSLADELVYGTTDDFWQCAEVAAVQPPLRRPPAEMPIVNPPVPSLACRSGDDGGVLNLLCETADEGVLRHASGSAEVSCSRAGSSMVIDFVFVGTVACEDGVVTKPLVIAAAEDYTRAAEENFGIYNAIMQWGSDHLPVGAEISAAQSAGMKSKQWCQCL